MKPPINIDADTGEIIDPNKIPNPEWANATHEIWFVGLHPKPVELGGDGVTGPYDPINIGPPPK